MGAGVGVTTAGLGESITRGEDADVGDLRTNLNVDPAEALVACGEVCRGDGGAELTEPAETAERGRAIDSSAEVTTIEETKRAELVTEAADGAAPSEERNVTLRLAPTAE
ncbi:unnamed protein product [Phytophthora fragariaefolia]|uniref:Unnamed protein product n=1 Tax=Phytophthora fragariaefolia TaxID=1490495 RepID=A0A9W7D8I4_9STRA|nr:unnamed protein product [Phytophthora fragariaefolia]